MANQTDLIKYLHAAAFSPVKSTYIRANQKLYFQSWPVFTVQLVNTCLPNSVSKVHIDQAW